MFAALFAIGLAASLENIQTKLAELSPTCRVFSYLDDVMVVAPPRLRCLHVGPTISYASPGATHHPILENN